MKYRVIVNENFSCDIITENGNVASFYYSDGKYGTSFFKKNLKDCDEGEYVWDELGSGDVYYYDWDKKPKYNDVVEQALDWLVIPSPDVWEEDDNLFNNFFKP